MNKDTGNNLRKLFEIQEIDIHIDNIIKLRGTLPEEVETLIHKIQALKEEKANKQEDLNRLEQEMFDKKEEVKALEQKVLKYKTQQMEVRNNREYEAIFKELELSDLDTQLIHKFLSASYQKVDKINHEMVSLGALLNEKEKYLFEKKLELDTTLEQTEKKEKTLHQERASVASYLDPQLYQMYEKIRKHVSNNLVVVPIKKGACGGCCIVIPPYQRLAVQENNKLVCCEHCDRMLVAPQKMKQLFSQNKRQSVPLSGLESRT